MDFTEVIIEIPSYDVDRATDIAHMAVPYGLYIEDYSNLAAEVLEIARIDLIDEELLKKDPSKAFIHIYFAAAKNPQESISFLFQRYTAEGIVHSISTAACNIDDFINNWRKYFRPLPVGERLLIKPVWHDQIDPGERTILHLEPGLAFGTGTHETTRLCLELLEKYLPTGGAVLDIGCGSGILSIASLLLGATSATGVDVDEMSVRIARDNAKINGVGDQFTAISGTLDEKIDGKFEIIVANIVADVIININSNLDKYLDHNSVYIMSGIIDSRESDVLSSLHSRFHIIDRKCQNGWVALAARFEI